MSTTQPTKTVTVIRRNGTTPHPEEVWLHYELAGDPISDDYTPDEISATALFDMWADRYRRAGRDPHNVPIYWFVGGLWEAAMPDLDGRWFGDYFFPLRDENGMEIPLAALPLTEKHWIKTAANTGGFIHQATGWKPSPMQSTVDLDMLTALRHYPPTHKHCDAFTGKIRDNYPQLGDVWRLEDGQLGHVVREHPDNIEIMLNNEWDILCGNTVLYGYRELYDCGTLHRRGGQKNS